MKFGQIPYLLEAQCNQRQTNMTAGIFNNLSFFIHPKAMY